MSSSRVGLWLFSRGQGQLAQVNLIGSSTRRNLSTPMGGTTGREYQSPPPDFGGSGGLMKSWQIHSYGGPGELQLSAKERVPPLGGPQEVLVKVLAASVNPIDLAMTQGYGAETINLLRDLCPQGGVVSPGGMADVPKKLAGYVMAPVRGKKQVIEFPLTLGRDFAGIVERVGAGVETDVRVGDEVYGVVGVQRQGSHAEYVVVSEDTIRRKPKNLSFVEAASLPYVALTTWSALRITGNYCNLAQKKFLVLGGSGGVGTFAVQYLKSQGASVVATCSPDAIPLITSLGVDKVVNYTEPEHPHHLKQEGPYDCILHLSGPSTLQKSLEELTKHLKPVSGQFITLSPPFLSNVDNHGLIGGVTKNLAELLAQNVKSLVESRVPIKWAFFVPRGEALRKVSDLVESQAIKPVIHSTFPFEDLPSAYRKLEQGHLRGKVVVNIQT